LEKGIDRREEEKEEIEEEKGR
jgi:hypothetical protein